MVKSKKIRSTGDAVRILRNRIRSHTLLAIHLTRSMTISHIQHVKDGTRLYPEVIKEVVNRNTEGLIVARNQKHLDSPKPTKENDGLANELFKMGLLLGVCVLDHILLGKNDHYSYKENGRIFNKGSIYRVHTRRKEYKLICG
jgi:DNA repair protein RadC